jgi:hypothetical protein
MRKKGRRQRPDDDRDTMRPEYDFSKAVRGVTAARYAQAAVKTFDCVEKKNAIQAEQRREWKGLPDEEVRRRIQQRLETSKDPLARKWRRLRNA